MSNYEAGMRISEYVLEKRVGTGSFGEVWLARHHIWKDDRVAVKLPTEPQYVRYLQREGIVVHGLRHPNIVRVIGLDPYADVPYLVMEYVDGPSLRRVIDEHPLGLPVKTATTILRGVLAAMVTAHTNGVLHRDLKPGNVMLDLAERPLDELCEQDVKVSDFGLGVANPDALREIVQSASIDRENTLVGTMAYMAPEVRDGGRKPDARADLYAIGVILFEMLTGDRPAGAELPGTVRSEVPERLDQVFRRLYARYQNRYESAQAVLDDLTPQAAAGPPPLPAQQGSARPVRGRSAASAAARCPHCGHPCETYDQFCTQCGRQIAAQVRRCPSCGGYPGPRDEFCIFCGARLPASPAVAE